MLFFDNPCSSPKTQARLAEPDVLVQRSCPGQETKRSSRCRPHTRCPRKQCFHCVKEGLVKVSFIRIVSLHNLTKRPRWFRRIADMISRTVTCRNERVPFFVKGQPFVRFNSSRWSKLVASYREHLCCGLVVAGSSARSTRHGRLRYTTMVRGRGE